VSQTHDKDQMRDQVKKVYGDAALRVLNHEKTASCCESSSCCGEAEQKYQEITQDLYSSMEAGEVPDTAMLASLGCGNPTALAELKPGETVLDLGSGGGIDVLLSAKRVGPTGFAYGLDMTDEMLKLAEENKAKAGATNIKFLKGHIEEIPLPDASVDVVISNCVINLSVDKDKVLKEAFRVLKPGGRFAVSDIVIEGKMPEAAQRKLDLYAGCVSGALPKTEYLAKLASAGFTDPTVEETRVYDSSQLKSEGFEGRIFSGFVRATKPN